MAGRVRALSRSRPVKRTTEPSTVLAIVRASGTPGVLRSLDGRLYPFRAGCVNAIVYSPSTEAPVSSCQEPVIDSRVSSRGGPLSSSASCGSPTNRPRIDGRMTHARQADTYRASRESWGGALMLLVIALILATIALAALEVWVFWKLDDPDDLRRRRERQNAHASKGQTPRASTHASQRRRSRRSAADLNRPSVS